jgi:hypothetical protein
LEAKLAGIEAAAAKNVAALEAKLAESEVAAERRFKDL